MASVQKIVYIKSQMVHQTDAMIRHILSYFGKETNVFNRAGCETLIRHLMTIDIQCRRWAIELERNSAKTEETLRLLNAYRDMSALMKDRLLLLSCHLFLTGLSTRLYILKA